MTSTSSLFETILVLLVGICSISFGQVQEQIRSLTVPCSIQGSVTFRLFGTERIASIWRYRLDRTYRGTDGLCEGKLVMTTPNPCDNEDGCTIFLALGDKVFSDLPLLEEVDLEGHRITTLTEDISEGSPNLKTLDLTLNDLHLDSIQLGSSIKKLNLAQQLYLNKIGGDFFNRHPSLTEIEISDPQNVLEFTLESGAFEGTTSLRKLTMKSMPLKIFKKGPFLGSSIKELILSSWDDLTSIEDNAFGGLDLESLDLSSWSLSNTNNDMFSTASIKQLLLQRARIEELGPRFFAGLKNCEKIDLSSSDLVGISSGAFDDFDPIDNFSLVIPAISCCKASGIVQLNSKTQGLTINKDNSTYNCKQPNNTVVSMAFDDDAAIGLPCCDERTQFYQLSSNTCQNCTAPDRCDEYNEGVCQENGRFECFKCSTGYRLTIDEISETSVCEACQEQSNCTVPSTVCNDANGILQCNVCSEGFELNSTMNCVAEPIIIKSTLPSGIIIGICLGALTALTIISIITIVWLLRRRKQRKEKKLNKMAGIDHSEVPLELYPVEFTDIEIEAVTQLSFNNIFQRSEATATNEYSNMAESQKTSNTYSARANTSGESLLSHVPALHSNQNRSRTSEQIDTVQEYGNIENDQVVSMQENIQSEKNTTDFDEYVNLDNNDVNIAATNETNNHITLEERFDDTKDDEEYGNLENEYTIPYNLENEYTIPNHDQAFARKESATSIANRTEDTLYPNGSEYVIFEEGACLNTTRKAETEKNPEEETSPIKASVTRNDSDRHTDKSDASPDKSTMTFDEGACLSTIPTSDTFAIATVEPNEYISLAFKSPSAKQADSSRYLTKEVKQKKTGLALVDKSKTEQTELLESHNMDLAADTIITSVDHLSVSKYHNLDINNAKNDVSVCHNMNNSITKHASKYHNMDIGNADDTSEYHNMDIGNAEDASEYHNMDISNAEDASEYHNMGIDNAEDASEYHNMDIGNTEDASEYHNMDIGITGDASEYHNMDIGITEDTSKYKNMEIDRAEDESEYHNM